MKAEGSREAAARWLELLPALALGCAAMVACDTGQDPRGAVDDAAVEDAAIEDARSTEEFSLGLTAVGEQGLFKVRVVRAEPAPPQKYENAWRVEILDGADQRADDVELQQVQPFMPRHGHDGTFEPTVRQGADPGTFDVERINLWMGGDWEVRFFLARGNDEDRAVLLVHIED